MVHGRSSQLHSTTCSAGRDAKARPLPMNGYKVVVTKSTVPIGTGEHIRTLISEHKKTRANFGVVSNPEFLREGAAINDFMRPDRVVIDIESAQIDATRALPEGQGFVKQLRVGPQGRGQALA